MIGLERVRTLPQQFNQPSEHQDGEREEVEPGQGRRQAFIVAGQAPKAGRPPETALHHPAPREPEPVGVAGLGCFCLGGRGGRPNSHQSA